MRRVLLPVAEFTARQLAGSDPIVNGSGCITWHSTEETTGSAAASYSLTDGIPANNQRLMIVTLSEGQSTRDFIGLHALPFVTALYLDVVSGTIDGSFTAWVDHVCEDWYHTTKMIKEVEAAAAAKTLGLMAG